MSRIQWKVGPVCRTMDAMAARVCKKEPCCTPIVTMMDGTRGRRASALWCAGVEGGTYGVFAYGDHWLHFVYDYTIDHWFYSTDTFSRSTTKHQGQLAPLPFGQMTGMSQEELFELYRSGGTANLVRKRILESAGITS